eukprot:g11556.t1
MVHDEQVPDEKIAAAKNLTPPAPSAPQRNKNLEAVSLHHAKKENDPSKQELKAGHVDRVTDSSSTSTACTPYEEEDSQAQERSPLASEYAATPRAVDANFHPRAEASWDDAVLSFSVTEQALTSDGVLIELCSGGVGEKGLVASGTIPGDVTMQLICRLRSKRSGGGPYSGDAAASASTSESLAVKVRLFAKDAGKDAGVCSLNLNFSPDEGNETSNGIEGPDLLQAKARRESESPTAAPEAVMTAASPTDGDVAEGTRHRQSSLTLLEETARHIEAIEEVCQLVRRQHDLVGQPNGGEHESTLSARAENPFPAAAEEVKQVPPPPDDDERLLAQREAAVVLQSHTRRRAATKVAKKRVKERTAANRVQAFARQRMEISKVRRARELELALMQQKRSTAAVRLQSTARRRIATNAVKRQRSEEADLRESLARRNEDAAAHTLQGFARRRLCEKSRRKHLAATRVQGIASIRGAKAEARRRRAAKQLHAEHEEAKETAARKIQTFTRRQRTAHERQRQAQSREQGRAAVKLQSMARCRSARSQTSRQRERLAMVKTATSVTVKDALKQGLNACVAFLMEKRRRAEQSLELERQAVAGRDAAIMCIQGAVRRRQAISRVDALRKQRDVHNRRAQELLELERQAAAERDAAVMCIQRAVRTRQATDRVDALRKQRDADNRRVQELLELERQAAAERDAAVMCIQRAVRCRQATDRVDALRKQRDVDNRQAQELLELERQAAAERDAAVMCIQRAVRCRQATDRVDALRKQRDVDNRQAQELLELERQAAAERDAAVMCIQRAVRCRQATDRVDALRKQRDVDNRQAQELLELERQAAAERDAAVMCIQRAVRCRQATDRVDALRKQRDVDNRQAQELLELERQAAAERDAAVMCIQRAVRCRQATDRVDALRKQRDVDNRQAQELLELERQAAAERDAAVMCIQRAVRCRQATDRVDALRKQRDVDNRQAQELLELERQAAAERDAAVMCIQRAVRCRQATDRVDALRKQRDVHNRRAQELLELERQAAAERDAACTRIQGAVRTRQATDRVDALRKQRDVDNRRAQELLELERQAAAERDAAVMCIQRAVRCSQARLQVAARRERDAAKRLLWQEAESESVSAKFAKMLEVSRKQSTSGADLGLSSAPIGEQRAGTVSNPPFAVREDGDSSKATKSEGTPAAKRWEWQEKGGRGSVSDGSGWSGSSQGTVSSAVTGSDTEEPDGYLEINGIDDDGDAGEQRGEDRTPTSRGQSTVHELNEGEGWADDTFEVDAKQSPPVAGDQVQVAESGQEHGSGEDGKPHTQLAEASDDVAVPAAAAADEDGSRDMNGVAAQVARSGQGHGPGEDSRPHTQLTEALGDAVASAATVASDDESRDTGGTGGTGLVAQVVESGKQHDLGEGSRPHTQLDEPDDAETSAAAAADGDESRDTGGTDLASSSPETVGLDGIQTGSDIPPQHPSDEEDAANQQVAARTPSTLQQTEHDEVSTEYPTAAKEIAEGWEPHQDEGTGMTYYFHRETGATSWDFPSSTQETSWADGTTWREGEPQPMPDEESPAGHSAAVDASQLVVSAREQEGQLQTEKGREIHDHDRDHYADAAANKRDEWQEVVDPDSGSSYFYNPATRQSTWAMPEGALAVAVKAAETAAAATAAAATAVEDGLSNPP